MFHSKNKKQTQKFERQRPVNGVNTNTPTFSYRASRSRSEQTTGRREDVEQRDTQFRAGWIAQLPTYIALLVIIGCIVYASTVSAQPRVEIFSTSESSSVARDKSEYQQSMTDLMSRSLLNYSKLTLDTNYITSQLQTKYPEIKAANIALPLVNRQPVLQIELARPVLTITSDGKTFAISEQGTAMLDVTSRATGAKLPIPSVIDQSNLAISAGKPALTAESVKFIRTVVAELKAKGVTVESLALAKTPEQLDVRLSGQGYYLKFNLLNDVRQQTGTYLALKQKLDDENTNIKEYIDLRVDERAYIK